MAARLRAPVLEVRLLGPLDVRRDGAAVPLRARQQRVVLALLALSADAAVSTDRLADVLWGERPPASGRASLQNAVADLRRALGDRDARVVATVPGGYVLHTAQVRLDLRAFGALLEEGRGALARGDAAGAEPALRGALAEWRGEPLSDLVYEAFAAAVVPRLEELRAIAQESWFDAALALGRHSDVVPELRAALAREPLRERFCGQLMVALHRAGRTADALAAYRDWRTRLRDELGLEPSRELRDVEAAILRDDGAPGARDDRDGRAPAAPGPADATRAVLAAADDAAAMGAVLPLATALAGGPRARELILLLAVPPGRSAAAETAALAEAGADLARLREQVDGGAVAVRTAAVRSDAVVADALRMAVHLAIDAVVIDARDDPDRCLVPGSPCDVVAVAGPRDGPPAGPRAPLLVPFGGGDGDWRALEIAAWLALTVGGPLRLAGPHTGSGRTLATASLILERFAGVPAEPIVVEPGAAGLLDAARAAGTIVLGTADGGDRLGSRREIAARAPVPALVVVPGGRPSGLAPPEAVTRVTWSLRA